jgi:hypothetical protein
LGCFPKVLKIGDLGWEIEFFIQIQRTILQEISKETIFNIGELNVIERCGISLWKNS